MAGFASGRQRPRRLRPGSRGGFTLIEAITATGLAVVALVPLSALFAGATQTTLDARQATVASVLASQKLEQLRALDWRVDDTGRVGDVSTDTASATGVAAGGTGLSTSPPDAWVADTNGWTDYIDQWGAPLGGGAVPPGASVYVRRWSITPLASDPSDTLLIRVRVMPAVAALRRDDGTPRRGEARLVAVRTRTMP